MVARGAYPIYRAFWTCSSWTRPRLTRMNRGALWQDGGSKRQASSELEWKPRFKDASYEIRLLYSFLLWKFNKRPNPISRLVLSLFLLLPLMFSRLDVFYGSSIDYMQNPFSRSKCFPLINWILRYTLFHKFDTLGSHLREEGSLDYDGGLVCL
jgi:hypothetical protein